MWLAGIVTIIDIVTFLIFPKHYKKIALILGITGLLQITIAGLLYYPFINLIGFLLQSIVGLFAVIIGAIITRYGIIKKKDRRILQN